MTVDLGYLTNAGFTFRRGLNVPEDDQLGVEVAVRISDHPDNEDGATQVVSLGVHTGEEEVSVVGRKVTVKRRLRPTEERPYLVVELEHQLDEGAPQSVVYQKGEKVKLKQSPLINPLFNIVSMFLTKVTISGTIRHHQLSGGETGEEALLRLILPPWLVNLPPLDSWTLPYMLLMH